MQWNQVERHGINYRSRTGLLIMDPYEKKLSEMKGYVPFLDKMISRLEKVKDGTKDQQLSKMKDLLKVSANSTIYSYMKRLGFILMDYEDSLIG